MNNAQSIYKSDYVPYDWLQNNCDSLRREFCTEDNVDDCLKYISQEFCALGYPSIYTNSSSCPFAVNCDIVNYLNVTYDVLKICSNHLKEKEDFECRNHRLSSDLNQLNKKNAQLKSNLELTERKYASALERERQLKEKNEQLVQSLKNEKEESKKLTSQNQQQKVAYQRELRKSENDIKQMKTRMNQLLSDKNSSKKVANLNMSSHLQRNNGQRGKWQTGATANSALEEMYNTVISSYEKRCQDMQKEVESYRKGIEFIKSQMFETIGILEGNNTVKSRKSADSIVLNSVLTEGISNVQNLEEIFEFLFSKVKEKVGKCYSKDLASEINALKLKIFEYEKLLESRMPDKVPSKEVINLEKSESDICLKSVSANKSKESSLKNNEVELSTTIALAENKMDEIDTHKLNYLKYAMQQNSTTSQWHEGLNYSPSVCVITKRDGTRGIASADQLKHCLSAPEQFNEPLIPITKSEDNFLIKVFQSKSLACGLTKEKPSYSTDFCHSKFKNTSFSDLELPKWAVSRNQTEFCEELNTLLSEEQNKGKFDESISQPEEFEVASEPSSEELNLLRLKAAIEDIEQKRLGFS